MPKGKEDNLRTLMKNSPDSTLGALSHENVSSLSVKLVNQYKEQGRKIVGWYCNYVPEEIIYAADMLPIRIMAEQHEGSFSDGYLHSNMCSFARGCLTRGLKGEYRFLDGIAMARTCNASSKLYDNWCFYVKTPFEHQIDVPHKLSDYAFEYYYQEIRRFKKALEEFLGRKISDEKLREAIEIYNESRALLRRLNNYLKEQTPLISGSEMLQITKSSMVLPKDKHISLMKEFLTKLPNRAKDTSPRVRLLVSGSIIDSPEFMELIEDLGGLVVANDLCIGTRYFLNDSQVDGDPLAAIARRYIEKPPCAVTCCDEAKFENLVSAAQSFHVDGVIFNTLQFCDTHSFNATHDAKKLERLGIPSLQLKVELPHLVTGQLKTRVQAFIEMIASKKRQ